MISGKDVNFNDETHVLTINGEKHAVGDPGEIDELNERLTALEGLNLKVANVSATMSVITADVKAIGGYRSVSSTAKALSTFTGFPTGKTIIAESLYAYGENAAILGVVNVINHDVVYLNGAVSGDYNIHGVVFYKD